MTQFGMTGTLQDGILDGDLVVQGGQDPFFVWEEAIAIGNLLNQSGIQKVTGNLIVIDSFFMNFETSLQLSGELFKQGLNAQQWPVEAAQQFQSLPAGTPKPQVAIAGEVQVVTALPAGVTPLVRHQSFPMAELLEKMNRYSNNPMAEMLALAAGGPQAMAQTVARLTGVPTTEVQLINGSGLGVENQMSPRAAVGMFRAIAQILKPHQMTIADVFTVVGQDTGVLDERALPSMAVLKSGTLNEVSALAGALPTQSQGTIWFAIINFGGDPTTFRLRQEAALNKAIQQWGAIDQAPEELRENGARQDLKPSSELI